MITSNSGEVFNYIHRIFKSAKGGKLANKLTKGKRTDRSGRNVENPCEQIVIYGSKCIANPRLISYYTVSY